MVNVGSVALKLAGRDAGEICAVLNVLDSNYVLVEGNVRRRKCNIKHLEFVGKEVKVDKNSLREDVLNALKSAGFKFREIKKTIKREKKVLERREENKLQKKL